MWHHRRMKTDTFAALAERYHEAHFRHHPTWATTLGRHEYDDRLEDFTLEGARAEAAELREFQRAFEAIAPDTLTPDEAADRTWLLATLDGQLQTLETFRPLERDPDAYAGALTYSAFTLINRDYAPAETRLTALLSRLAQMPAALELARTNLKDPPKVTIDIALDQLDGNRSFFRDTVPAAFPDVASSLRDQLVAACARVDEALARYGAFLSEDLLDRAPEAFAIGEAAYLRKLRADELLEVPLERLIEIGEADLRLNQEAMREAARAIDPAASLEAVLERFGSTHVRPEELLSTTQGMLADIVQYLEDHGIVTVPSGPPLHVVETPPFMRATTTAAMDVPGFYEAAGTDAYYYMTLPNPAWSADEQEAYMQQWTRPLIANLSVHEAFPGHYIQFLLTPTFPTLTRRIAYARSNAEGWAHYCEQMMYEEGFWGGDPWYRIAQLQDALLRNARLVVGIRLHTGRMTLEEAKAYFEREAFLASPVAKAEAWRGTVDPTYGYYTLGKLMMLKLRDDVKRERGTAFNLKAFHDEFLALGPLPLPLVRQAMLGAIGDPL